ncbi:hypothetical protein SFRURICE_013349 [Spodoptera frugiperda]|nr:hypothetical protein SFRURICE_013349 [Spodoptera frugiperda]
MYRNIYTHLRNAKNICFILNTGGNGLSEALFFMLKDACYRWLPYYVYMAYSSCASFSHSYIV